MLYPLEEKPIGIWYALPARARARGMKKSYIVAFCIAATAMVWILSGIVMPAAPRAVDDDISLSAAQGQQIVQVRVRDSTAQPVVNDVIVTGRTQPSRRVDLRAETAGQIVELKAEKGASVQEGDVIALLEEGDRTARMQEGKERLKQREIEYKAAKSLETKGFNSRIRLAQARADLESAKTFLKSAQVDLDNIAIRAPFDGVIDKKNIDLGDFVSVGDMLYTFVDLDPVKLVCFVTERAVGEIQTGATARASLLNGMAVEGVVSYIAAESDPQARTFEVEIDVPNPDMVISAGMTAKIYIPVAERKAHKISPSILTLNDAGEMGVKIIDENNRVLFLPVYILSDEPDYMWVDGLPQKVRLITVGQDFVISGQLVNPVPAEGDGLL